MEDKVNNETQGLGADGEEKNSNGSLTFPLSICLSYVNDWDTSAAFREIYQNWKDAILERFGLDRLEFQPTYEENDDYISVTVPDISNRGDHSRALGFIKFEKAEGRMIIANAYKFGYNFPQGKVNRDRQMLVDRLEVADIVRRIWEAAFQSHKQLLLPIYINLLREFPDALDVGFAQHLLEKPTRTLIWKHLLDETEGRHFYYSEASYAQSIGMIRDVLKKEPRRLPGDLWDLLRSASPIRTPEEEQIHCFKNSELCTPPGTYFSWTIQKALQACLAVFPQWKHITVHFVRSENIPIDVFYDSQPGILKVNQRWLYFDSTHGKTHCRDFTPNETSDHQGFFFCNHVIEDLLRTALPSLLGPPFGRKALENALLRKIRNTLRFMPHSIKVMTTAMAGGLMITWEDNETESIRKYTAPRCLYHVILHDENCPHGRTQLLHGAAVVHFVDHAYCGCPQQFITQLNKTATFFNLQTSRRYYPMISLNQPLAFYGLPSQPVAPSLNTAIPSSQSQWCPAVLADMRTEPLPCYYSPPQLLYRNQVMQPRQHQQVVQAQKPQPTVFNSGQKRFAGNSTEENGDNNLKRSKMVDLAKYELGQ